MKVDWLRYYAGNDGTFLADDVSQRDEAVPEEWL